MSNDSVYKEVLLDHFHNPRNKGDLDEMHIVRRGSNPRCGDEIEVGITCDNGVLETVRFRGRGCSICLASASMMTECTSGLKLQQARQLIARLQQWFGNANNEMLPDENLAALGSIRQHPARKKCVLLAWQALDETLDGIEDQRKTMNP
jgi:nitrogen fixation NifU-like protein